MVRAAWLNSGLLAPKPGGDVLRSVAAGRSFASMELPMRRVLLGSIRLPGLAAGTAEVLG